MSRQHCVPILLGDSAVPLELVQSRCSFEPTSEADIQALIHRHPGSLPIAEIDSLFCDPVPICTELNTRAGAIDNFMVTTSGLPIIVECKLWRNPEGRREVIGQILDYAKELSRWTSSDLQREVSRRLNRQGNPILELVRERLPTVDEIAFNDTLTQNLRRGRFLLLIVGDGIREGVEAIADYLQRHAGLHFSLGLVELPIYAMPSGGRIVVPRVLARTAILSREVVAVPDGFTIREVASATDEASEVDPERIALADAQEKFWAEFLQDLTLDDPEQQIPKPARAGNLSFMMPAPSGSSWITCYRDMRNKEVGVFLSAHRNTVGELAMQAIVEDWENVKLELEDAAEVVQDKYGRPKIMISRRFGSLDDPTIRAQAFHWLRPCLNNFVNVIRPRVRSEVGDHEQ
ncbi:MAG: hypothetical protein J0I79_01045 [Mesorhizobium sp.]|uniref:hypothetical protein n=1 Tax=Mesorhizobium sp. TaxID=1871066 RepID=UPI001AD5D941|nr:hypothetical protein [Mesorhizobium sp.]MBN9216514.1 hypothetical protein [Mesorhizobium sp.]